MKRYLTLSTVALALTAWSVSLPLGAAADPPPVGTILTVAGTGSPGYSGDNGPATKARLTTPAGVAFDAAGNLYIAEWLNNRVRKVSPEGTITTVAGTGKPGFSGDGGKATAAQLHAPVSPVVDGAGNLYISEFFNHRVRKVTPDGIITTYAGSGPVEEGSIGTGYGDKGRFYGDNGPATDARLNGPTGLAVDALGNLFIADWLNHRVRKVSPEGVITTVAGNGLLRSSGDAGDGGQATEAGVDPWGLAVDLEGNLFIIDLGATACRVRKLRPNGIITTVAGADKVGFSGDGGPATEATLWDMRGLAVDSAGNLFIADLENYRVRRISPDGIISTVAGIGKKNYAGDGGLATETALRGPQAVAIDPWGNLFIADSSIAHEGNGDGLPSGERIFEVVGAAAPGLLAGVAFPQ